MDATPEELEGIQLRWTRLHPDAGAPNDAQSAEMLTQIRQHEAAMESKAVRRAGRALYPVQGRFPISRTLGWIFIWVLTALMVLIAINGIAERLGK